MNAGLSEPIVDLGHLDHPKGGRYSSRVPSPIDLRSDTVTQPTAAMRQAMANAVVGDDGFGEDPTIAELESTFATMAGKAAAVFVPSGVMANQIALRVLTRPGDVVAVGRHQHVVGFERGAAASNAAVQFYGVDDERGVLDPADVADAIGAELDHQVPIAMVSIENTHMFAGGVPWSAAQIASIADVIGDRPLHLDGARIFNASVATGESVAQLCARARTVSAALSKGLCAPVGSLLAGSEEDIERARVERKRLGGAMRQAGFLAAAGLVGLRTMVTRLADDHDKAHRLAVAVANRFPESNYDPSSCRTNIVAFNHPRAREIARSLDTLGVRGDTIAPMRARYVTHADVSDESIDRACEIISLFSFT